MGDSMLDLVRAVKKLGVREQHFQYPDVREQMGIGGEDKLGSSKAHNLLKRLIKSGALEIVPGGRERNRYYRIKNEEKLRQFVPVTEASLSKIGGGADRLARIEMGIQSINDRLGSVEAKLAELIAAWS